jgi:protein-L-isoaspartate(D-aspartate) O-methyltransferase
MKDRPSFPAKLDSTLAKNRPNAVGGLGQAAPALTVVAKARPASVNMAKPAMAAIPVPHGVGMDSQAVRQRMVQKLAGQGVTDPLVLQAMGSIERHRFVDSALVNQAYEDTSLPIGLGQTISKPGVVSRMIELLRNSANGRIGRVLEIGTGCGYQAAVLSCVANEVYSIERLRGLHDKARDNLRHLRLANVHLLFGDGMVGYAQGGPYAGIISAAGGDALPQAWIDQLAMGGRLVAPTVHAGGQALMVVDKTPQGIRQSILEAVHFVPLKSGVA